METMLPAPAPGERLSLPERLDRIERWYYATALKAHKGNAAAAARSLGIQEHSFRARAVTLGIRERVSLER